jgi:hypothetical protein
MHARSLEKLKHANKYTHADFVSEDALSAMSEEAKRKADGCFVSVLAHNVSQHVYVCAYACVIYVSV